MITESAIPTDRIKPQQDVLEATTDKNELKNSAVEAFFDYQILFDRNKNSKIIVFGNLIIKNTGNTVLQNPIICFQLSPKGNVNFTGQLVPPNIAETRGVVNSEKGWKYMYDDWFQQAEEKGEIWICPIKSINILPGQKESFQNFQISLVKEENQQNLKVEGYVYFQEQGLQYKANNRITLSF
ncbi:hypothetical protein QFZ28_004000 [Neobacillus niacini]|uniref:hypothetical protein n=1 Tax=Neobacillus niacini TaxID=86668 RepID=UPI0027800771|nr:hypothetical protein [Neobacillus niacini]MDQ1003600.1 hypothetical protein [Neobacillus niacini]